MALHELFTNAVKYGALSNDTGRIEVRWSSSGDDEQPRLKLSWREMGGPAVLPPKRRGFGSLLLERTLAQDLNGQVTTIFDPEGIHFSIDAPMPLAAGAT
jgi:two-component sensor histidine kinase